MHRTTAVVLIVALVTVSVVPAGTAAQSGSAEAYSGTHVAFETADGSIVDYRLDGEPLFDSVAVESRSEFEARADADVRADGELAAVTDVAGTSTAIAA